MTPDEQRSTDRRVQTACLLTLTVLGVGAGLAYLKPVLVPFVLAVFFTYCLTPLIELLKKRLRLPDPVAILGAILVGLIALGLIGFVVARAGQQIYSQFDQYEASVNQLLKDLAGTVPLDKFGMTPDESGSYLRPVPEPIRNELLSQVGREVADQASRAGLVVLFMVFLLLGRSGVPATGLLAEIEERVQRFLTRMMFFSALTGVLVYLSLLALGVPFALAFGFLAFLLNFIPSVGSVLATLLPLPIILLSPDLSIAEKILAFALLVGVQCAVGVLQPKFIGNSLDLHPVALVLALLFFGKIWGSAGAFLAAPLTAVIKIALERHPATRWMAALLAGNLEVLLRPAGAPPPPPKDSPPELAEAMREVMGGKKGP
jgi:AI-2 transport protein TqsA